MFRACFCAGNGRFDYICAGVKRTKKEKENKKKKNSTRKTKKGEKNY